MTESPCHFEPAAAEDPGTLGARMEAACWVLHRYGLVTPADDFDSALLSLDLGMVEEAGRLLEELSARFLLRILLEEDGARRLPRAREMRDYLLFGESPVFLPGRSLYLIPTVEGVAALAAYLKRVVRRSAVEVGAGDGFLSRCLMDRGVDIKPTDPRAGGYDIAVPRWVERLDALDTISKYRPDVVLWAWAPPGCREAFSILEREPVRIYLDMGPDVSATHHSLFETRPHRELHSLGRGMFGRTDWGDGTNVYKETRARRFFGRGHPRGRRG